MASFQTHTLPKWILVVSALFALLELSVSIMLAASPQSVLEKVDLGAKGVDYLVYMWAARQFALGFILAFAAYKRSAPMLTLSYIFLLVMFVGDVLIGIWQRENALIGSAVFMCILSAAMIYFIHKRSQREEALKASY